MADPDSMVDIMNYLNDPFENFTIEEELGEARMQEIKQEIAADGERKELQADNGLETSIVFVPKGRRVIKPPRALTDGYRRYKTSHYALYDDQLGNKGSPVHESFKSFSQYDGYTLYCNPNLTLISEIPTEGVRLDDMTAAFVLMKCDKWMGLAAGLI